MPKKKKKINTKLIYFFLLLIGVIFAFIGSSNSLKTSDYFKITDVAFSGVDDSEKINRYVQLKGENLFKINLNQIEEDILQEYLMIRTVKIQRVFPNKVHINIEMRKPIAKIKAKSRYLFVDIDGKEIKNKRSPEKKNLPRIIGLDVKFKDKKLVVSDELLLALKLLKNINESEEMKSHDVVKINISNIKKTSFSIDNGIQVKIGDHDFKSRLKILSVLLKELKSEIKEIKYVDLRYKEPVIAKK